MMFFGIREARRANKDSANVSMTSGNIRELENVIGRLVRRFLPLGKNVGEPPKMTALRTAINKAVEDGINRPVKLKHVAEKLVWKEKKGYTPQALLQPNWSPHIRQLRAEGEVKRGYFNS